MLYFQCHFKRDVYLKYPIDNIVHWNSKEEEIELNKNQNQTKSQLLTLIDENIENLPEELL